MIDVSHALNQRVHTVRELELHLFPIERDELQKSNLLPVG